MKHTVFRNLVIIKSTNVFEQLEENDYTVRIFVSHFSSIEESRNFKRKKLARISFHLYNAFVKEKQENRPLSTVKYDIFVIYGIA